MRYSVVKLAWDMKSEDLELKFHTLLSLGLLFVVTAFILMMLSIGLTSGQAFSLILNITGGIVGSFANFILPSAIYLKVMPAGMCVYVYVCIYIYIYVCMYV